MSKSLLLLLCSSLMVSSTNAADARTPVSASKTSNKITAPASPEKLPRSASLPAYNPLFAESSLQYQYPAFDQIRDEHYAPAFDEAMREHDLEIKAIAESTSAPTFDNTIVALERSGRFLGRVSTIFESLKAVNTNPTMDALANKLAPELAAHSDAISLNPHLFKRIQTLYRQRESLGLDPESSRLLEIYHTDFVRAGAQLSEANKTKLKAMNGELASLENQFSQNVLKEINASAVIVNSKAELAGYSEAQITAAANAATARGLTGKYLIALTNTTVQPPETTLQNRALRERIHQASIARGNHGGAFDNRALVIRVAKLRAERAKLLGYPSHAAYVLANSTAKTTTAVNTMLGKLAPAAIANAKKEAAELQKLIDADKGGFQLTAWDWDYYSEQLRKQKYDLDESQLRPYLELNNVLQNGVFFAAHALYGISFKERKDLPIYEPNVRVFEVFDSDGSSLALFLFDPYARSNKQGGAWMNSYVDQSGLFAQHAVVANHLNIPKPADGEPTLLTFDEVRTAFHEFGHALHAMFSNVRYPRVSGTNVPRDFVEYPSQVNEMWAAWPEVLSSYAKHYQTGASMPQSLLDKLSASKKFNQGFVTSAYLSAALLDQSWHQLSAKQIPTDAMAFEAAALKKAGMDFAPIPPRYRSTYFSHVFSGGYSSGYYGYIWAEVLDADSVEWFKENGGLQRKNGDWFRQQLLSRGGSIDPLQSFRNFRGRDPQIDPLLIRRGLKDEK